MSVTTKQRTLLAALTAVLLLSSSITPASIAVAQSVGQNQDDEREWKAYTELNYSFCDANVLAQFWGINTEDAKLRLGRKILLGDQQTIDQMLGQAYSQFGCQQGFNFEDAPNVAELWAAAPAA